MQESAPDYSGVKSVSAFVANVMTRGILDRSADDHFIPNSDSGWENCTDLQLVLRRRSWRAGCNLSGSPVRKAAGVAPRRCLMIFARWEESQKPVAAAAPATD